MTLNENTTKIQQALEKVRALPNAGGAAEPVLEELTVTPGTNQQEHLPGDGVDGFSKVTTEAIPSRYQDVSGVTATPENVLAGDKFVTSDGTLTTGTMINNGAISLSIDGINSTAVNIPSGHTSGGTVSLTDDIPNEVNTQSGLISQILTLLDEKAVDSDDSGGSSNTVSGTCTLVGEQWINDHQQILLPHNCGFQPRIFVAFIDPNYYESYPIWLGCIYIQQSGTTYAVYNFIDEIGNGYTATSISNNFHKNATVMIRKAIALSITPTSAPIGAFYTTYSGTCAILAAPINWVAIA